MNRLYAIAQLLLRCSLAIGFMLPVLDRLGFFGTSTDGSVVWGNWTNFTSYTNTLMPYVSLKTATFFGFLATLLEAVCSIFLLIGFKVRYTALISFGLTLIFAVSMMFFLDARAPFNYSVFVVSFSSLMLATCYKFPWSIDTYKNQPKAYD